MFHGDAQRVCSSVPLDIDSDGDGFTRRQGDCNDNDGTVYPGNAETTCNSKDDDCNGVVDDGFNVGANCGEAAGQSVWHAHIHVIPRYKGDTPNPKGGVRHVIPLKGNY